MTPPIVPLHWTEGRYGSHYAAIGKVTRSVASINYSTERADPEPYIARVDLPGLERQQRKAKTLDEAKAIAAAVVNKWLRDALTGGRTPLSAPATLDEAAAEMHQNCSMVTNTESER